MAATRWQTPSISRFSAGDVVEQRVQRGQALVAGADVVAAVEFEVAQEADDPFEGEVAESQARDLAMLVAQR